MKPWHLPGTVGGDTPNTAQVHGSTFRAELQGLRGLAILLVMLNHAAVPGFGGGFVGVDIFFVLSGYLIGGLLLRELAATGRIDLWAFYARRVRRLLPAAMLVLGVTVLAVHGLHAPQEQDELLSSLRAAAFYAINLWFATRPVDYFGGHTEANPALHLWSLAVEEQFYVLWPLLMLVAFRLARRRPQRAAVANAALLIITGVTSLLACLVVSWLKYRIAFFITPCRMWEFAAGMAVASASARSGALRAATLNWLGGSALLALALITLLFDGRMRFPGFWVLVPVSAAATLLLVTRFGAPSMWLVRGLQMRWLRWLGDCSYSVYLWHWPVLIVVTQFSHKPGPWLTGALLLASVGLGWVSYRWVEQPFLQRDRMKASPRRLVVTGLACCMAIGLAAQLSRRLIHVGPEQQRFLQAARWDRVEGSGCLVLAPVVDHPACEFGHAQPVATVVLFGDSHAAQWFEPLEQLALQHRLRLVLLTKAACPSVDVPVQVYTTLNEYWQCAIWREQMFRRIEALRPAVVLLASSSGYAIRPAVWQSGLERTLQRMQRAGARVGYLRDTPFPEFNVPVCHARAAWRGWSIGRPCTYLAADNEARLAPLAEAERAALSRAGAASIDVSSSICAAPVCDTARGEMILFKDRNHLSAAFALSLAPQLEPHVLQLLAAASPRPQRDEP